GCITRPDRGVSVAPTGEAAPGARLQKKAPHQWGRTAEGGRVRRRRMRHGFTAELRTDTTPRGGSSPDLPPWRYPPPDCSARVLPASSGWLRHRDSTDSW